MIQETVRDEYVRNKKTLFHQKLIIACASCAIGGAAIGFGFGFGISAANMLMRPVSTSEATDHETYVVSEFSFSPALIHNSAPVAGHVNASETQPFLGIVCEDLSEDLAAMYNLPQPGVFIRNVIQGAPADVYGLKRTDIIIGFNDEPIYNIDQLVELISNYDSSDNALIEVIRDGKTYITIDIVLLGKSESENK